MRSFVPRLRRWPPSARVQLGSVLPPSSIIRQLLVNFVVLEFQSDQVRFVVNRDSRMVSLRLKHVVAVNHLSENRLRVGRREADRRPGEADERRVRQRPAKLVRETFR